MELTHVSLFAGIGGLDEGFARADITTTTQVEWNEHCQTILRRHYPNTRLLEDVNHVSGTDLGSPDVISAGFPCQELTIAAPYRPGLDGPRSGEFFNVVRLAYECRPRWVVIENTPGLLTLDDGRHAAIVFRSLEELGYGWAYRVVDARHHGTTSRRPRVLVVGHLGGDPRPAWQVLGDAAGRGEVASPAAERAARKARLTLVGSHPDEPVAFRKSARPRAALSKGGYETWVADGNGNVLTGFDGGGPTRQTHLIVQSERARTLTLTEWERLQGFDDGWTEGIPDSARFTALGNAVHVGTAEWLARRLRAVDEKLAPIGA